jgi:replicative DNA helicase
MSNYKSPYNESAERGLLGCLINDKELFLRHIKVLDETLFYNETHKTIFRALKVLAEKNSDWDSLLISAEINNENPLSDIDWLGLVVTLCDDNDTTQTFNGHLELLVDLRLRRETIINGTNLVEDARRTNVPIQNSISRFNSKINTIASIQTSKVFVSLNDLLTEAGKQNNNAEQKKYLGIATGYSKLDDMTLGFQNGQLIIVAGEPRMGKTALALNIAHNITIEQKKSVGFISLEMKPIELMYRLITASAEISYAKIATGNLSPAEIQRKLEAENKLENAKIHFDDRTSLNINELINSSRLLKAQYGVDLLIIDHLQRITDIQGVEGTRNMTQTITEAVGRLKTLARELDIPIMLLSQLTRAPSFRNPNNRRPTIHDVRGSGAIEENADIVLLLFREEIYNSNPKVKGFAEVNIGKQKNGPEGLIILRFDSEYMKFKNCDI